MGIIYTIVDRKNRRQFDLDKRREWWEMLRAADMERLRANGVGALAWELRASAHENLVSWAPEVAPRVWAFLDAADFEVEFHHDEEDYAEWWEFPETGSIFRDDTTPVAR